MRVDLKFDLGKNFNLFLMGDDHIGNAFRYDEGVDMVLNMLDKSWNGVKASANYLVHHGDPMETIFYDDRRYDQSTHAFKDSLFHQIQDVCKQYRPFRRKMLFMLDGNHSNTAKVRPYGNPTLEVCNQLQIPFGSWVNIATYQDGTKVLFRHYAGHGWGSVSSRVKPYKRALANMSISLRAALEEKASNCMLLSMGHTHKLLTYRPDCQLYVQANGGGLKAGWSSPKKFYGDVEFIPGDLRWYANTGSFVKLSNVDRGSATGDWTSNNTFVSGYAEQAGYDPIALGFCIAEVRDGMISDVKKIAVDDSTGIFVVD